METFQPGLTLIDCCVVLGIISLMLSGAVPAFEDMSQRRHLEGVASEFATDLQFARTESVSRAESVRMSFGTDPQGASVHGTVSLAASITVAGNDRKSLRHVVNIMGRVRTCAQAGAVKGYPAC